MSIVFDAAALIAYPRDEPGAEVIEAHLIRGGSELYVHALNLCEVYYDLLRASDEESAEAAVTRIACGLLCARADDSPGRKARDRRSPRTGAAIGPVRVPRAVYSIISD